MSVVVALKQSDGSVYMAADAACHSGGARYYVSDKLVIRKGIGYGLCGSVLATSFPKYANLPSRRSLGNVDPEEFVFKSILPAMRECAQATGVDLTLDDASPDFLIVLAGKIFVVESWHSVYAAGRPYAACGSGFQFAMGYLYGKYRTSLPNPEKVARQAVEATIELHPGVGGDIYSGVVPA